MKKLFSEIPHLKGNRLQLRRIAPSDVSSLEHLARSEIVYRYLPTFLYERKYPDMDRVIRGLYTECFQESIILGIFDGQEDFCGLAEMYGFRDEIHKVSIGYRLLEEHWGKGIATETVGMMTDYLLHCTDIEIITASTMIENRASANVLLKNGFTLVNSGVGENWGYPQPTIADKWIL